MIPAKANAEFVCCLEDVLDVYTRPYDPLHPSVCFDESNKQLVAETQLPLPAEPGQPERYDYQYERHGVANLFMFFEPLGAWRHVEVTERRTAIELSVLARQCLDRRIPDQETLKQEVTAWEKRRNQGNYSVDWRFTTTDARIKLKRLYPSIQTW